MLHDNLRIAGEVNHGLGLTHCLHKNGLGLTHCWVNPTQKWPWVDPMYKNGLGLTHCLHKKYVQPFKLLISRAEADRTSVFRMRSYMWCGAPAAQMMQEARKLTVSAASGETRL